MANFHNTYNLPKLKQGQIHNLNKLVTCSILETVFKSLPKKMFVAWLFYHRTLTEHLRRVNTSTPQIIPQNRNRRNTAQFVSWGHTLIPKQHKDPTKKENCRTIFLWTYLRQYSIKYLQTESKNITKRLSPMTKKASFQKCRDD